MKYLTFPAFLLTLQDCHAKGGSLPCLYLHATRTCSPHSLTPSPRTGKKKSARIPLTVVRLMNKLLIKLSIYSIFVDGSAASLFPQLAPLAAVVIRLILQDSTFYP